MTTLVKVASIKKRKKACYHTKENSYLTTASAHGRHETDGVPSLFRHFPLIFQKKRLAEVIFRYSWPISVKIRKMALGSNDLSTLPLIISSLFLIAHAQC